MVQAARRRDDDGEYVTKGDLREALAEFKTELLAELMPAITHTNKLNEMLLDEIKPNWRETLTST